MMKKEKLSLFESIRLNVMAYHNNLSKDYVYKLRTEQLLALCHPTDREKFEVKLNTYTK